MGRSGTVNQTVRIKVFWESAAAQSYMDAIS